MALESDPVQFEAVSKWLRNCDTIKAEHDAKQLKRATAKEKTSRKGTAPVLPAAEAPLECHLCILSTGGENLGQCARCQKWVCTVSPCSTEDSEGTICQACEAHPEDLTPEGEVEQGNPDADQNPPPGAADPAAEAAGSPIL